MSRCSRPSSQAQVAGEAAGRASRRRQLGVVRPGPAVEVVRADRGPGVVDDAHLGVHVDGRAGAVLDAVDRDPVAAGRVDSIVERLLPADEVGRQADPAVLVGVVRQHARCSRSSGLVAQRRRRSASATSGDHRYWSSR